MLGQLNHTHHVSKYSQYHVLYCPDRKTTEPARALKGQKSQRVRRLQEFPKRNAASGMRDDRTTQKLKMGWARYCTFFLHLTFSRARPRQDEKGRQPLLGGGIFSYGRRARVIQID